MWVIFVRVRKKTTGDKNIVGEKLLIRRKQLGLKQKDVLTKLQLAGIEMSSSALSKIEGQDRSLKDYELAVFCEILNADPAELLGLK